MVIGRPGFAGVNEKHWCNRFGGEHPLRFWTRLTDDTRADGLKSPGIGYAPPEFRKKPWPQEAQIAGWSPLLWENKTVSVQPVT
jgi:hypothetical protein